MQAQTAGGNGETPHTRLTSRLGQCESEPPHLQCQRINCCRTGGNPSAPLVQLWTKTSLGSAFASDRFNSFQKKYSAALILVKDMTDYSSAMQRPCWQMTPIGAFGRSKGLNDGPCLFIVNFIQADAFQPIPLTTNSRDHLRPKATLRALSRISSSKELSPGRLAPSSQERSSSLI